MNSKTIQPKARDIQRSWHLVDAEGKVLGRLSTEIASYLMGKQKPNYATHLDQGDYVVVVNAEKIVLTGQKKEKKVYWRHSGYPGGMHLTTAGKLRQEHPTRIIEHAVSGMLPKNKLQGPRMTRLHVYVGTNHPYANQLKSA